MVLAKKKQQIKISLRKKVQRKLTWKVQYNKTFKNRIPLGNFAYVIRARTSGTLNSKKIEVARVLLRRALFKNKPSRAEREKKETRV